MQQLLIAAALLVTSLITGQTMSNQTNEYNSIEVSVTNVTSEKGTVEFALYTEEGFLKSPIATKSSKISNRLSSVVFENVPAGVYSIVCFHDANENNRMDFEMNGMPLEHYGSSNNVLDMGPPRFDSSKFEHGTSDLKLEIKF